MADLREVLSKYVPQSVLDDALEEIKETDIAPEWWRTEMSKVAPDAKRARELDAELESIRAEPKRVEAYKRVGLLPQDATDASGLKKYQKDWLNEHVPHDRLDDLDFLASQVKEGGFEVSLSEQQQPQEQKPPSQAITEFLTSAGQGAPVRTGQEAADEAFYRDLDSVPDGDKQAVAEVLAKHGRLAPEQG